jgi:hypothetical protein
MGRRPRAPLLSRHRLSTVVLKARARGLHGEHAGRGRVYVVVEIRTPTSNDPKQIVGAIAALATTEAVVRLAEHAGPRAGSKGRLVP